MREADRALAVQAVVERRLRQEEASARLGVGVRQVKRLAKRYRERGAAGMVSGHRRRRPNNALDAGVRQAAMSLVRERCADFGPTFAAEKLSDEHGLSVSRETLRKWMAEEGLWRPKRRREARVHRAVRAARGSGSWRRWTARRTTGSRGAGRAALGPLRRVPGQPEGERGRADAVHAGARDAGHRADPRQHAAGEGAGGARQPDAAGSAREGDAAAGDRRDGGGERVPAGVHGGLQPALRGGAAGGGGRAPSGSARRRGAGPDPVRAGDAEAVEEPDVPVRAARVPAGRRGQGPPPSRRGGDGVQGLRRHRGGAAQGRRLAFRVLAEGEAAVAVEDEKGVRDRVDAAKAAQAGRPDWKPAPDHPWRRPFKPAERAA